MQTNRYYVVEQIEQAFFSLMREKDYTDITVTDIIKKAQVSRASFYRHFSSISDVLERSLANVFDQFSEEVVPILLSGDEKMIREFLFAYTYKNLEMHEVLASCLPSNTAVILSRFMYRMQNSARPAQEPSSLAGGMRQEQAAPAGGAGREAFSSAGRVHQEQAAPAGGAGARRTSPAGDTDASQAASGLYRELSQEQKYLLSARTGVINAILMKWIADGRQESVEEIVSCIMKYVMLL